MADKEKKRFLSEAGGKALLAGILDIIEPMAEGLNALKQWYESFPADGDEVMAVVNRKAEVIAPAANSVLYTNQVVSATLQALSTGKLPAGLTAEQYEQMKAYIGDERFNELDQAVTLEAPETVEQKIAKAIEAYDRQKAMAARMAEEMARMAEQQASLDNMASGGSSDVEDVTAEDVSDKGVVKPKSDLL